MDLNPFTYTEFSDDCAKEYLKSVRFQSQLLSSFMSSYTDQL